MNNLFIYDGVEYSREKIEQRNQRVLKLYRNNLDYRISESLKFVKGGKILDVGCNDGAISRILGERGHKVVGIDILQTMIDIAKEFNEIDNVQFEQRNFLKEPFPDESFDCIIFLETIEHVLEPSLFLKEFHRILRNNGKLIISTPNATSLKNMIYALSYRKKSKQKELTKSILFEEKSTGTQLEHVSNWDFPTLVRLLDRTDFDVVDQKFITAGPITIPIFGKKIKIIKGDSKILNKFETLKTTQILECQKRTIN